MHGVGGAVWGINPIKKKLRAVSKIVYQPHEIAHNLYIVAAIARQKGAGREMEQFRSPIFIVLFAIAWQT
jgi:ethanolamine ammonia-lyase large subunit